MNNLSWRWVQSFILVAEHGSFTEAAAASGHSKANLSQQVTELEAALGVQLLHRTTRSLRLTTIGEGFLQRSQQAMSQFQSAAEWAQQAKGQLAGSIRMNSVGGSIGEDLVAPLVYQFQRKHPQMNVELDFSSSRVNLLNSHYDLVIRMGDLPDSSLVATRLHTITTRYVASQEFLVQHGEIQKPEDLKTLPLIFGSVDHWILNRAEEQRLIHVRNGIRIPNGRAMRHAALAGLGITRLTDLYVDADIRKGCLCEVLPSWSEVTPLSLVSPPHRYQITRVRLLIDWLKQHFPPAYKAALQHGLTCAGNG